MRHQPTAISLVDAGGTFNHDLFRQWLAATVPATEAPALFSEHRTIGYWELWKHRQQNNSLPERSTPASVTARAFEPVIARLAAADRGLTIDRPAEYLVHPENQRAGCWISNRIVAGDTRNETEGPGILEARFLTHRAYQKAWIADDGSTRPPADQMISMQAQYYVSGVTWGALVACVEGERIWIDIPRDEALITELERRLAEFWKSLAEGREPLPDYRAEASAILAHYNTIQPKTEVEDPSAKTQIAEIARHLLQLESERGEAAARLETINRDVEAVNARLAHLFGTAEYSRGEFVVRSKMVTRRAYTAPATSFRTFAVDRPEQGGAAG